jgi:hypothetical protein
MATSRSFEVACPKRVKTPADAVRFIDAAGFCVLFPLRNVQLPSLYYAVTKRSDVRWDKYAQLIWRWKDDLPKKRRALYTKYFKGRGTFLSLELLPHFLAMHGTAVSPEDAASFYAAGRISHSALELWDALDQHGPLATLELRHACKMDAKPGNVRFKKAMLELQRLLVVTHSGAEQETESWASNRFELVSRAFPKHVMQAQKISPQNARATIAAKYRGLYPGASPLQLARLFGWTKAQSVEAPAL